MEKIKRVLEILQDKNDHAGELWGDQLAACVRMLGRGIAELEQKPTFTIKIDPPGTAIVSPFHVTHFEV